MMLHARHTFVGLIWAHLISGSIHILATEESQLELLNAVRLLPNSAHRDCISISATSDLITVSQ